MEKYRKAGATVLWVYFWVSTLVTFSEYSAITEGKSLYLILKIILQIWLLGLCVWIKRDPYGVAPNLWVGIHIFCSNIHGVYFSPWYFSSFIEMIIAYSFLFSLPRRYFNTLLFLGTLAFLGVSMYRHDAVFHWVYQSQMIDLWPPVISASAIAWLSHNFFTADRSYREELVRKFGIIGVQTAAVVHDLKSMLAAPRMYVDVLKKKTSSETGEIHTIIASLEAQLLHINRAVTGLNQVVALQNQEKENFEARKMVLEVAEALNMSSRQVQLNIVGDTRIYSEKALLKSILFNILMNSIQAFRKNKIIEPLIEVACEPDTLIISDNAGGFPLEVLESLENSKFPTFDSTGIGLFLVWNGVQSCGGSVRFSNIKDGAQIRIMIPSKWIPPHRYPWHSFFKFR